MVSINDEFSDKPPLIKWAVFKQLFYKNKGKPYTLHGYLAKPFKYAQ